MVYILFAVLVLLQLGDWYSTKRAMDHGTVESNPVVNWVIRHLGLTIAMLIKIVWITTFAALATQLPYGIFILLAGIALYVWVIIHNWKLV